MDHSARKEAPPQGRLEVWLERALRGGGLKAFPRYRPPGDPHGQCPEQYARTLLDALRTTRGNPTRHERCKDDGRSFRSWAESAHPRPRFRRQETGPGHQGMHAG